MFSLGIVSLNAGVPELTANIGGYDKLYNAKIGEGLTHNCVAYYSEFDSKGLDVIADGIIAHTSPNPRLNTVGALISDYGYYPAYSGGWYSEIGTASGTYFEAFDNLQSNTEYYIVMYVTTALGTVYLDEGLTILTGNTSGLSTNVDTLPVYAVGTFGSLKFTKHNCADTKTVGGTNISPIFANGSNSNYRFGLLYSDSQAANLAPSGWRIPTDTDWTTIINSVPNSYHLKVGSATYWNTENGTNEKKFYAVGAGKYLSDTDNYSDFKSINFIRSSDQYHAIQIEDDTDLSLAEGNDSTQYFSVRLCKTI